ncbi:cation:proton antiporter [Clostridium paraputrificum]|uniref:cation:proton antiporter n=1 Tax=Clostridium paraputrificum TaxID=29363 RepID=UPI00189938E0|nr:cation:proton antiporter [Clostridium paraputrificum]MDB2108664.1 cation:proton antiporter [Clostridium paraputrificum]
MILSLAVIITLGLIFNKLFKSIKLPGLLGMLILGIIVGPNMLNLISNDILTISPDLRKIALIVILLRAGLGINRSTLKKVGKTALKMSFLPCVIEGFTIAFVSKYILNISFIEAGMLGFIIAAVSPAVVVPQMLELINKGKGRENGVPTIILAASSIDDVFAITIFSTFLGLYGGSNISISGKLLSIPISILLGGGIGILIALLLIGIFKKFHLRDTEKTLIILALGMFLTSLEDIFKNRVPIASLLGVMVVGFILLDKYPKVANRISEKFNKVWVFAEILLFVLVGAQVDVKVIVHSGLLGLLVLFIGLVARSIGVYISLMGSNLNFKEKIFCIISFMPKATVQAAMGAVPLASGVASGNLILAIAVLSIIVTAPLGAVGIKYYGDKWIS